MREIMMAIGKESEQETLMKMLDREESMEEETEDFNRNFWKLVYDL